MKKLTSILINGGTHGTESLGQRVIASLKELDLSKGRVDFMIANERAVKERKRFIESDLNRSFPGRKDGTYEERLAHQLLPRIKSYDVVIDVHSTESELKSCVIVTKLDAETMKVVKATNAKNVLYMKATEKNALISNARIGIGLEFGKDRSTKTFKDTRNAILLILQHFKILDRSGLNPEQKKLFLEVYATVPKPRGFRLTKGVENLKVFKKGEVYGFNPSNKTEIKATQDFYPVLFGEKRYKDIFGFSAKKLNDN
ncbi:MAG: succinylglutamate desuccinylase/aspartoacylase family protein [Candidatus Paceibacterota bacterium]|jgi:predicted deacylase